MQRTLKRELKVLEVVKSETFAPFSFKRSLGEIQLSIKEHALFIARCVNNTFAMEGVSTWTLFLILMVHFSLLSVSASSFEVV